jgi:hypothetical protein
MPLNINGFAADVAASGRLVACGLAARGLAAVDRFVAEAEDGAAKPGVV